MIRLAYPDLDFKEVAGQLKEVINSGWLTGGPKTEEFEDSIRRYLGVKYAVAVSSGTAALHLSLLSLGIGPGDEVIVPDFTFPATANAVELCGAKVILVDIEPDNFNIDPVKIKKRITKRTRAIIPVHQFGTPASMDEIMGLARKHRLYVVEDAACAFGARYKAKMCGTIGDVGCFSFHPRKNITTGEGGAVVSNNAVLVKSLRLLREHGMVHDRRGKVFIAVGFNYRISEVASVLGLAQLKRVESIIEKKRRLSRLFRRAISHLDILSLVPKDIDNTSRSVYQSFVVKINTKVDILELIAFLKGKGIESVISNIAIHVQPYYKKKYGFRKGKFKNSLYGFSNSIALPFHCRIRRKDISVISNALSEYFLKKKERR